MDNKEEMIEDLDIVETVSEETIKFEPITEPVNEVVNAEVSEETNSENAEEAPVYEEQQFIVEPKKSKAPLLVFLIILLVLDIAALVIYIIGIDKVLGFIK